MSASDVVGTLLRELVQLSNICLLSGDQDVIWCDDV